MLMIKQRVIRWSEVVRCIDVGSLWQELNVYQEVYVTATCVRAARAMNSLFSFACTHM